MRDLRFGKRIGKGNVGEVFEGWCRGQHVAVKRLQAGSFKDRDLVDRFRDEIYLLSTVTHPNVLVFVGAVLDRAAGNLCLVTELCRRGNLAEVLGSSDPLSWGRRVQMASDVARGMHYLHGRAGIIQRDLKTANLLLDDFLRVKIADFGLSRSIRGRGVMDTYCGTPATMAPEIVMHQDYDEKADVFSFAIIMWEILTREQPYRGQGGMSLAMRVATKGLRPDVPVYCPAEWAFVMQRAWAHSPEDRPGFDEILDTLLGMQRLCDEQIETSMRPADGRQGRQDAAAGVMGGWNAAREASVASVGSMGSAPRVRAGGEAASAVGAAEVADPDQDDRRRRRRRARRRERESREGDAKAEAEVAAAYQSAADLRRRGATARVRRRRASGHSPTLQVGQGRPDGLVAADEQGMRLDE